MVRNLAIVGLLNLAIMLRVGFRFVTDITEYSAATFQNPLVVLCMATGMILAKIILQETHLLLYSYNGTGFFLLKFVAIYLFVMGQALLSIVFVGLSFGMGIKNSVFSKILSMESLQHTLDRNTAVMTCIFVIILCHALTAIAIFYDHEEDHKYHDYQGKQGLTLCILRVIMFVAFIFGLYNRSKITGASSQQLARESRYFRIVGLAGTLYLLSLPAVVAFTNYALENLSQQSFIVLGSFACQTLAILCLQYQFTVKHSAYYEISYKNSTFLPSEKHE